MRRNEFMLGYVLKQLQRPFEKTLNQNLQKFNLTGIQLRVLVYLIENLDKEINQVDIENHLGYKNPTVTGILKRLEEKGFIRRGRSERDKRYKSIVLTEKGRELPPVAFKDMEKLEKQYLAYLDETEGEQLKALLLKLLDGIRQDESC